MVEILHKTYFQEGLWSSWTEAKRMKKMGIINIIKNIKHIHPKDNRMIYLGLNKFGDIAEE